MLINKKVGYTNVVGILAEIMEQTRKSTIKLITSLDTEKLDYMDETFVNSLAKLTMHICAVEKGYIHFFRGTKMTKDEIVYWNPFLSGKLINVGRLEKKFDFYEKLLWDSNQEFISLLSKVDDEWLLEIINSDKLKTNRLFHLFHRLEDEIQHQGQMKLIIKKLLV